MTEVLKPENSEKKCYEFAIDYAKNHPEKNYVFNPQNLGDNINSKDPEYYPSITIDGKKIVFTRRVHESDAKGNELTGNEDFYESELIDGQWSKAKPLEGNINSPQYNEGAQNISQDGTMADIYGLSFS